eukprot:TRINITY_DN3001_c0_g1_i1.p2 TRINITY_DN3001_c0_g1~~TRINITY_DN3001_c0_g1_i1.p2  ORF type:complete len:175 (-),score=16.77 TRINITY_DN3001_c0_g1_i1:97-567(-)
MLLGRRQLSSKSFGGVHFKEVCQDRALVAVPRQQPTSVFTKTSMLALLPGEFETVMDLLASELGPFFVAGLYLATKGCFQPEMSWVNRLVHIEASTFLLYGLFFVMFASKPFMYWVWFLMLFCNSLKTLLFIHLSNPWHNVLDKPMRIKFTLKRML